MIITVGDLQMRVDTGNTPENAIRSRLEAIEAVIRAYTNNKFQVRAARFCGHSEGRKVYGASAFIREGDTVEISESGVNDGLYTVIAVDPDGITLDKDVFPVGGNLVTKVQYPADVVACAADLYKWSQDMGDKVGVKSETISRHSVTYEDSATLYMGYPAGLLNGLRLHRKARC